MNTMIEDKKGRSITFKEPMPLDKFSDLIIKFNSVARAVGVKDATLDQLIDWLILMDVVTVSPSLDEINKMMVDAKPPKRPKANPPQTMNKGL